MNIHLAKEYYSLTKPKVVALMLITAWAGMFLASQGHMQFSQWLLGTIGIGFAAASAATINQILDRHIDAKMDRTALRPIAKGQITPIKAIAFATALAIVAGFILWNYVNPLTTWLTFATLFGYAFFYTLYLKRATPQNIVIGGLAGATPPLLGWTAIANETSALAWIMVLIIFTWTPPHFWALAIYRRKEYASVDIPMLPVTHGVRFTTLAILLYTVLLTVVTILPFAAHLCGSYYFVTAMLLNGGFLWQCIKLYRDQHNKTALKVFNYSIVYLIVLFLSMLIDQHLYSSLANMMRG